MCIILDSALDVLASSPKPLKAREIASHLRARQVFADRTDVSRALYDAMARVEGLRVKAGEGLWRYRAPKAAPDVDRLPRARAEVLRAIMDASGIDDHDLSGHDARYLAWKRGGRRGPRPGNAQVGGHLDSLLADGGGASSLVEAFERACTGAKTWRDVAPVIEALRHVPGFERATLPMDVLIRHGVEDGLARESDRAPEGDCPF